MPAALSLGSALVRRQATSLPANIRPRRVATSRGIKTATRALLTSSPDLPSKPTWEAPEMTKDIVITVQLPADTTRKDIDVKMFKDHITLNIAGVSEPAIGGDLERTGAAPASMSSSHAGRSGSTGFFLTTPNVARGPLMAPAFSRAAAARRPKALSPFLEAVRDDPPCPCAPRPLDPPEFSSGENSSD